MFKTILDEFNLWADALQSDDFPIVPHDYSGNISSSTFIKFMVVFQQTERKSYYDSNRKIPGLIMLSIFYPAGKGQNLATEKASELLSSFENKTPIQGLQTNLASLQFMGKDPDNKTLSRADLTIPFNYYGD